MILLLRLMMVGDNLRNSKKMNIVDFFNPEDPEHRLAFVNFNATGMWPQAFWDKHDLGSMVFPAYSGLLISRKCTDHSQKDNSDV